MQFAQQDVSHSRRDYEKALGAVVDQVRDGTGIGAHLRIAQGLGLSAAPQWSPMLPHLDQRLAAARAIVAKLERAAAAAEQASEFDQVAEEDSKAQRARAAAVAACAELNAEALDQRRRGVMFVVSVGNLVRHSWAPAIAPLATLLEQARAESPPLNDLRVRTQDIAQLAGIEPRRGFHLAIDAARTALHRQVGRLFIDRVEGFVVGALRLGDDDVVVRLGIARDENPEQGRAFRFRLQLGLVPEWRDGDVASWARGHDAIVLRAEDIAAQ